MVLAEDPADSYGIKSARRIQPSRSALIVLGSLGELATRFQAPKSKETSWNNTTSRILRSN